MGFSKPEYIPTGEYFTRMRDSPVVLDTERELLEYRLTQQVNKFLSGSAVLVVLDSHISFLKIMQKQFKPFHLMFYVLEGKSSRKYVKLILNVLSKLCLPTIIIHFGSNTRMDDSMDVLDYCILLRRSTDPNNFTKILRISFISFHNTRVDVDFSIERIQYSLQ